MGQGWAELVATSVRASTERLLDRLGSLLPLLAAAVVVLAITWALARLVAKFVASASRFIDSRTERDLVRQVSYYTVWLLGILVTLDVVGADTQAVFTGLGLGGVALGFALKDILSNFVSGLLILFMRTFEIGDQIVVDQTEGTVERIEVRATHIRTYDGRLVLVPNGEVFTSRVVNNTAGAVRRASIFLFLDYNQDLDRAMSIILDTLPQVPGVAPEPAPSVRLHDLTTDHFHLEARIWTDSRRTDFMTARSMTRIAIVNAFLREGIALPNPDDRQITLMNANAPALEPGGSPGPASPPLANS